MKSSFILSYIDLVTNIRVQVSRNSCESLLQGSHQGSQVIGKWFYFLYLVRTSKDICMLKEVTLPNIRTSPSERKQNGDEEDF